MPSRAETVQGRLADDRARVDEDFRLGRPEDTEAVHVRKVSELLRDHRAYWTALRRIAALHKPYGRVAGGKEAGWCWADNQAWPCKTQQILAEELLP